MTTHCHLKELRIFEAQKQNIRLKIHTTHRNTNTHTQVQRMNRHTDAQIMPKLKIHRMDLCSINNP